MKNLILHELAGNFDRNPESAKLSPEARELVFKAFTDLNGTPVDNHVHLVGIGTNNSGCWMNEAFFSWIHPSNKLKYHMYLSGAGIEDEANADEQYIDRLVSLAALSPKPTKYTLLALDKVYHEDGRANDADSSIYVPNEYLLSICEKHPSLFKPCISVHPYRPDAIAELEKWAAKGVKLVKWLPNSMGMDPSNKICEPFYEKMKQHDMTLLCHVGKEDAIQVVKFKPLGNPLLLRKPLDMGLKIIMAHCAGLGRNLDLDKGGLKLIKNFKLFLRLMDEKRYEGLLFGDISGLTQVNRCGKPLMTILERQDLHHRLINGSDYPLPTLNAAVSTLVLSRLGYIAKKHRNPLNELYKFNPLLFDFVLKRALRHPKMKELKFKSSIFELPPM